MSKAFPRHGSMRVQVQLSTLCTIIAVGRLGSHASLLAEALKGDLSDRIGYDFNQLRSAVKVMVSLIGFQDAVNSPTHQFATILHAAEYHTAARGDFGEQRVFKHEIGT